jgi:hypothetical protein
MCLPCFAHFYKNEIVPGAPSGQKDHLACNATQIVAPPTSPGGGLCLDCSQPLWRGQAKLPRACRVAKQDEYRQWLKLADKVSRLAGRRRTTEAPVPRNFRRR